MEKRIDVKKPEISVIMLTYNREQFVEKMINCILSQSYTNFEFIIIDNGSTDSSGIISDQYAKTDNRIIVNHIPKSNIGTGRNRGLDLSKGKYITFVDDDDSCKEDYLSFLYDLLTENNADISICGATWSDKDEKYIMNSEEAMEKLLWRKNYNVAFPTKMFRREIFDNIRFAEEGKYDDIYLMPKVIANANRIVYHGISKYHFERHNNNNSAWTQNHSLINYETLKEYLEVYNDRTKWLCKIYPNSSNKWRYFNYSFMISMVEKIIRLNLTDCYELRDRMISILSENYVEFINCPFVLEFEKEWMKLYIKI